MRLLVAAAACLVLEACCEFSGPHWHGHPTSHFDGERFQNQIPARVKDSDILRWRLSRHPGKWPAFDDVPPGPKPPERVDGLRVTLVNHATVLIQIAGVNILTDPVWGEIAGPTPYIGRTRHRPPGLRFEDLPHIDAVLISHDHYDHLDLPTLEKIVRRDQPRVFAGLGMAQLLLQWNLHQITELDWFKWAAFHGLKIVGIPARHGCRRGACDENSRLWLGFLIRAPAGDVYFAGDTGYGPEFQQLVDRYGPPYLALLPIAPGEPRWLFAPVHLDASDAVIAAKVLQAQVAIPVHFGTFAQGDEADGEAEAKLRAAADGRWTILHNGESFTRPRAAGGS